jgi:hypothetical protein
VSVVVSVSGLSAYLLGCNSRDPKRTYIGTLDTLVAVKQVVVLRPPDSVVVDEDFPPKISPDGLILVRLMPQFRLGFFNRGGSMVGVLGRSGHGPGEIRKILDFGINSSGEISVLDQVTDEILVFGTNFEYRFSYRPDVRQPTAFVSYRNRYSIFRRSDGEGDIYHLIVLEGRQDSTLQRVGQFLKYSDESIRAKGMMSQAISCNEEGDVAFAFLPAQFIYYMYHGDNLIQIPLDPESYHISSTRELADAYRDERMHGLAQVVFKNSRVISLGFVDNEILAVTFATGRYEDTRYFIQFYSVRTKSSVSKAYETPRPFISLGDGFFGQIAGRDVPPEKNNTTQLTICRFRNPLHE